MISLDPQSLRKWYDEGLESLRYSYDLPQGAYILDLGAYEGEWSERMIRLDRNEEKDLTAICVEPTEAIRGFGYAKEIIRAVAGVKNGTIGMSNDMFASSIYGDSKTDFEEIDTAELIMKYPPFALAKVNIEGYEYEVLNHLIDKGAITRLANIQVQFHLIDGVPCETWYEKLAERLRETHELTWQYKFCWENWTLKN